MADDRLDDAIDAVVRAVDRIERATRRQVEPVAAPPVAVVDRAVDPAPDSEADAALDDLADLQPPASQVAPGHDAWQPVLGGAGDGSGRPRKKPKKKKRAQPEAPAREHQDPDEVDRELHELVGRIVSRTQELDDHLAASRALRDEISELVARLAATADHRR